MSNTNIEKSVNYLCISGVLFYRWYLVQLNFAESSVILSLLIELNLTFSSLADEILVKTN